MTAICAPCSRVRIRHRLQLRFRVHLVHFAVLVAATEFNDPGDRPSAPPLAGRFDPVPVVATGGRPTPSPASTFCGSLLDMDVKSGTTVGFITAIGGLTGAVFGSLIAGMLNSKEGPAATYGAGAGALVGAFIGGTIVAATPPTSAAMTAPPIQTPGH
jgi:hypothetical protein